MKNQGNWYSRRGMWFIGLVLFVTGLVVALIFFPIQPIFSLLLFALIAGTGVFISCKQKDVNAMRIVLLAAFVITSFGYGVWLFWWTNFFRFELGFAFFPNFMTRVVPFVALGTLPFAWFGRFKSRGYSAFKGAFYAYLLYLLVLALPFVYSCMWDYNVRADTSMPEKITLRVINKYLEFWEGNPRMQVETLDGAYRISFNPTVQFYDNHEIGSLCETPLHRGALGYPWMERPEN